MVWFIQYFSSGVAWRRSSPAKATETRQARATKTAKVFMKGDNVRKEGEEEEAWSVVTRRGKLKKRKFAFKLWSGNLNLAFH